MKTAPLEDHKEHAHGFTSCRREPRFPGTGIVIESRCTDRQCRLDLHLTVDEALMLMLALGSQLEVIRKVL